MWRFLANWLCANTDTSAQQVESAQVPASASTSASGKFTVNGQRLERRARYVRIHALQLAERFSNENGQGILLDEEEYNWLIIPKYPMPERWRQRWTKLMILFPAAYPDVPPTGFYLTIRARLKNGEQDEHLFKGGGYYAEAPDLSEEGWFWYCVHAQVQGAGGWKPSADPSAPDNLFTFLNMAREALSTDA